MLCWPPCWPAPQSNVGGLFWFYFPTECISLTYLVGIHSVSPLYGQWKRQLLLNLNLVLKCLRILQRNDTTEHTHTHTHTFKLWFWRRQLRIPWTVRRSNQSILKEINPKYSLGGLRLKLKLQYFGHLMWRQTHWKRLWCWERLRAGEESDRGWDA